MADLVELRDRPKVDYMIVGWRQWADGGAVSSGLPLYLAQQTKARKIGRIRNDGFYLFQIPGMHDLMRPVVQFDEGYPRSLETKRNEFYYTVNGGRGVLFFIGDEPHLDIDRYTEALLDTAEQLGVKRIISLGGVYGELPYDKERMVSGIYSLPAMKEELERLALNGSDYHGGASIGSYVCKMAGNRGMEYMGMYAFVPMYDFSSFGQRGNGIRIENDFTAWLGIVKRINYMFKTRFDLTDLEEKSEQLLEAIEAKVDDLELSTSDISVRDYMRRLSDSFTETPFDPLDEVWEDELRRLFDEPPADE
jgi:proteasome assembly chaperone (PAC2) family protein